MKSVIRLFATISVLICCAAVADAATLQAKVVEVKSGNTLVVSNTSRSVRVRLKSVAPPEAGQPFFDAARDHLKALVLDQAVTVEYTHLVDGYLEARVFLNGVDIGSQMLRDGVAWFDHATDYGLKDSDRDLYAQCEQAARAEKRGLWQDAAPVAPWEYRRIQQEKLEQMAAENRPSLRSKLRREKTSFSNGDMIGLMSSSNSSNGMQGLRPLVQNGSFSRWTSFESPVAHFSVMVPSNGLEGSGVYPDADGHSIVYDVVYAQSDRTFLGLQSARESKDNLTDAAELDKVMRDLRASANKQASMYGDEISFKFSRDLKLNGYTGRQYSLTCNSFSGTIRLFTKQLGDERQVFLLLALARRGGEGLGDQFLNSFKITR